MLIAIVATSTLFVFGPARSFAANRDEFVLGLPDLLLLGLPFALVLFALILGALVIVKAPVATTVASVLLAATSLIYLQGNFLVWDYGLFDGNAIAWNDLLMFGVAEVVLWLGAVTAAIRYRARVRVHATAACGFLLLAQSLSLANDTFVTDELWRSRSTPAMDEELFRFSSEQNVIVLVLDAFQTSTFASLLARDPALRKQFDGFVFFPENTAAFSTTAMSIPAMLTGETYRNREPRADFLSRVLRESSLGSVLSAVGFESDLLTVGRYCEHLPDQNCRGVRSFEANDRHSIERSDASQLFELVLFRGFPHFAKQVMFRDGPGWSQWMFGLQSTVPAMQRNTLAIANAFRRESTVHGAEPRFKFIHYFLPHKPFHLDERCERSSDRAQSEVPVDDATRYVAQAGCALRLAIDFLNTLHDLEIYDRSMIVIASDHGMGGRKEFSSVEAFFASVDRALPLLLIKRPGAQGTLATSNRPTQLSDIPKTIADELGVSFDYAGVSAFRASEPRVRSYLHYVWQHRYWDESHLPPLQEFVIEGPVREMASWRLATERLVPGRKEANP